MAEIQRKVVNGVNTVVMHGKNYVEVAERVRLVHDQKREFEVLESEPFTIGDRCIWRIAIKVDGKIYKGNAEVKLNARTGPDATNPFECGETSALGRALAFAGFGSVESIASFDEVYRATNGQDNSQSTNGAKKQSTNPAPVSIPTKPAPSTKTDAAPENKNLAEIPTYSQLKQRAEAIGQDWNNLLFFVFADVIAKAKNQEATKQRLINAGSNLGPNYCQRIDAFLVEMEASHKPAA